VAGAAAVVTTALEEGRAESDCLLVSFTFEATYLIRIEDPK